MRDPTLLLFPRLHVRNPIFRRWWIDDLGMVHLAEVGLFLKTDTGQWDLSEALVRNPDSGQLEAHRDGERLFERRQEAICQAILRALEKAEGGSLEAEHAREIVRVYRTATEDSRGPVPTACLDCRGTTLWKDDLECRACRGTGVTIRRRVLQTVDEARADIERAFPGTAERMRW